MTLLAALDVGTTRVKAAVYRWRGGARAELVAAAGTRAPPVRLAGLTAEQDPEGLFAAARAALLQVQARAPATAWAALALTTQRGSTLLLGGDGEPVHPMVTWLDRRGAGRADGVLGWLKEHAPEVLAGAAKAATLADWLGPSLLKRVLPAGLRLVAAGGDKNSELIGAGGLVPGRAVVSFGTAVSLGVLTRAAPPAGAAGLFVTPAHVPEMRQIEVGLPFGGGVWAWVAGLFPAAAAALGDADLTADAPLFVPYLAGSLTRPDATGSWHGLTAAAAPPALVAAALEGILFDLRLGASRLPVPVSEIVLTGGGLANPVLLQWLADVLGVPARAILGDGAAGMGAGASGTGAAASGTEAAPSGRDASGRDASGRDASGRDASGRDASGRDASGRDASGRDASGAGPAGAAAAAAVALELTDWPGASAAFALPLGPAVAPRPAAAARAAVRYSNWLKLIN